MTEQICPGCGSSLPQSDGPTHAYMLSSPACWEAFNVLLEREYSNPELMRVHRLTVDSWAVQHPGDGSRRAIQSVGLHLARLWVQLEGGLSGDASNAAMLSFADRKAELPELPPRARYRFTVADVISALGADNHEELVRRWARSTWEDWADQHDFIKAWAKAGPAR